MYVKGTAVHGREFAFRRATVIPNALKGKTLNMERVTLITTVELVSVISTARENNKRFAF